MRALIALVFISVIALVITLIVRLGGFKSVELVQDHAGPFRVVYKHHLGAYHKIVPVIEEVEKWARANGEVCQVSFGEFLDNVETVPEDRLNSNAGCVLEGKWDKPLPEGFQYREIPRREYVIGEFEGAPSIGPMKVYPKAQDFMRKHALAPDGPVIEMYEIIPPNGVKTRYLFPVQKQ